MKYGACWGSDLGSRNLFIQAFSVNTLRFYIFTALFRKTKAMTCEQKMLSKAIGFHGIFASFVKLVHSLVFSNTLLNICDFGDKIGNFSDTLPISIRLIQCCTEFKSVRVKVLCVFHLHDKVAFTFKWCGNTWNETFCSQRIWIGYNIELAESVFWYWDSLILPSPGLFYFYEM